MALSRKIGRWDAPSLADQSASTESGDKSPYPFRAKGAAS
jgi:hypothetical protein